MIRLWNMAARSEVLLRGQPGSTTSLTWSPDGTILASASRDVTIRLWDAHAGQLRKILQCTSPILSVAWSPGGDLLASGSFDGTVRLWDIRSGKVEWTLGGQQQGPISVAWSPDGRTLASYSFDSVVLLWDVETGDIRHTLAGHTAEVLGVAFAPDGRLLASASRDRTLRLWEPHTGRQLMQLERHTDSIQSVAFSQEGRVLISQSRDRTIRLWRVGSWEQVARLETPAIDGLLAPHPSRSSFATLSTEGRVAHLWDLDLNAILATPAALDTVFYTNAKVVLLGDSGVGKSGLFRVLCSEPFQPTESTHGRKVRSLASEDVPQEAGGHETREIVLWDLAGQPGYRLIHQLHLNEVSVAILVFDSQNEKDFFAGVRHWDRALRQAQRGDRGPAAGVTKLLVAARTDRGGIALSAERIQALTQELSFAGYLQTSAKEDRGISELRAAIQAGIDWSALPKGSSSEMFQTIKSFLVREKEAGRFLSSVDDLYRAFLQAWKEPASPQMQARFETCIGLVDARGLIRRLSFGDLVLLQPERLDAYASALINAAREEPHGLGCISEDQARSCSFPMPSDERIGNREQERLLLLAMIEDMVRHEIALTETTDNQSQLVFPSQLTRERPDLPDPAGKAVTLDFEGSLLTVYATLAVRLSHSDAFHKKEMWKNAATYDDRQGGVCGMFLQEVEEGHGRLTLFFSPETSLSSRSQFEHFILAHLLRRAIAGTIRRLVIFVCQGCGFMVSEQLRRMRRDRGESDVVCPNCGIAISLLDIDDRPQTRISPSVIKGLEKAAEKARCREVRARVLAGKIASEDFDVFLAYHEQDQHPVRAIAEALKIRGIYPWLAEEQIQPGRWFMQVIEAAIPKVRSAAIILGPHGLGGWQALEVRSFVRRCVESRIGVIPVLLPGVEDLQQELLFLKELRSIKLATLEDEEALDQLEWGITGKQPHSGELREDGD